MDRRELLPASVLTGFLGSGKTTVLNYLLRHPAMKRAVVIVNEFGEIGLDHELIESATDDTVLLQNGCLCCNVRSDLLETLRGLISQRDDGRISPFDRVIIETTGLADPGPILQALMTDRDITNRIALEKVITAVDAVVGADTLDRHIEAVKQAAVADCLLLTKTDLADSQRATELERRLQALNPRAEVLRVVSGEVNPERLFGRGSSSSANRYGDFQNWEGVEKGHGDRSTPSAGDLLHSGASRHAHSGHDVNRHDDHIRSVSLVLEEPILGEVLDRWLRSLFLLKGPDLLRFKGIVNVTELPGPVVLHGVQHVIYPPVVLKEWPSTDRRTRLVFITYDIDESVLRSLLEQSISCS